jgi:hypothetical protein
VRILPFSAAAVGLLAVIWLGWGGSSSGAVPANWQSTNPPSPQSASVQSSQANPASKHDTQEATSPAETKAPAAEPLSKQLPAGTTIFAELTRSVSAKKARIGDAVEAKCTLAVLALGKVAIPSGAKIVGKLTKVKRQAKGSAGSVLGIAFDHVIFANGAQAPLELTIQAIGFNGLYAAAQDTNDGANERQMPGTVSVGDGRRGGVSGLYEPRDPMGDVRVGPAEPGPLPAPDGNQRGIGPAPQAHATLSTGSRGVVGLPGLTLAESVSGSVHDSLISSAKKNVKLDSGIEMILRVVQ